MTTTILLTLLAAGSAGAAQQDPGWLPFEGCWAPAAVETSGVLSPSHRICVYQDGNAAVFTTYVNGSPQSIRQVRADGAEHAVTESGCTGTESARWSADARRVFIRSDLTCGSNAKRSTTTVLGFVGAETYVDVQAVKVGRETDVRTIRYRSLTAADYPAGFTLPERQLARETARLHAAAALGVEDVVEASRHLHPPAVESLLAARRVGFAMNAADLRRMRAEGVAKSTIDVMVALTYPDRFEVAAERPQGSAERQRLGYWDPWFASPSMSSWYGNGLYSYNRYGYDCMGLSYYSSYMCDYRWGNYGYNYGSGGVWIVPVGTGIPTGDGGYVLPTPSEVTGQGYVRGTGQGTRATARPRGNPDSSTGWSRGSTVGSSGSSGSGTSGGSASGTGGVGSSGASAGSGSTSTGQTAKPRGGGE